MPGKQPAAEEVVWRAVDRRVFVGAETRRCVNRLALDALPMFECAPETVPVICARQSVSTHAGGSHAGLHSVHLPRDPGEMIVRVRTELVRHVDVHVRGRERTISLRDVVALLRLPEYLRNIRHGWIHTHPARVRPVHEPFERGRRGHVEALQEQVVIVVHGAPEGVVAISNEGEVQNAL